MKARTKTALLLVATLDVGGLIGAVTTGAIVNNRLDQLRALRSRGGFTGMLERVIEPTDEAQRAQIRAVLEGSEARFSEALRECRGFHSAARDSMRADLDSVLTPAQQTRLDQWLSRDRRSRNGHRGRNGKSSKRDDPR